MGLFREIVEYSSQTLTERLYNITSDYDIYCEFLGEKISIGQPMHSPLRDDDNIPSFSFFIPTKYKFDREYIWWRDFAGGNGNMFDFVQKWAAFNEQVFLNGRLEIIQYIDSKLSLHLFDNTVATNIVRRKINYESLKESQQILFKSREFTIIDLWWWATFGIDEDILRAHDVRSVKYLLNDDFTIKYTNGMYDLMYAFVVYDAVKLYSPNSIKFKWRNTCPSEYIFGEEQIENKDIMIITKSLKDIMTFKSFINCDSVSTQSETSYLPDWYIETLKTSYKYLFVVMDYDPTGIAAAKHYKENYDLEIKWVSKKLTNVDGKQKPLDKDISDYVKNNNFKSTFERLENMFSTVPKKYFKWDKLKYLETLKEKYS